jgi:hypothetical protein
MQDMAVALSRTKKTIERNGSMMKLQILSAAVTLAAATLAVPAHAVSVGQIDTFSSGVQGWSAGGGPLGQSPPVPPAVVGTGGPGGVGDAFLQITSDGNAGAGGRLVAMNILGQWSGNYTAAGVTGIAMKLKTSARPI